MSKIIVVMMPAICIALSWFSVPTAAAQGDVFSKVSNEAARKEGVKEITYDQFMMIRTSGEKYILLDVLAPESYAKGHIKGAKSLPVNEITVGQAKKLLPAGSKIIVYCGSFKCTASTTAAKKLSALGYDVLDYKGGLKEWQEKGNELVMENDKL